MFTQARSPSATPVVDKVAKASLLRGFGQRLRPRQAGFLMEQLGLAMIVFSLVAFSLYQMNAKTTQIDLARLQADALNGLKQSAHRLVMDRYGDYQGGLPVVASPTLTLADGDSAGQSRRPTVANLRAIDPVISDAQDVGRYKTLSGANYDIRITRPAVCALNPTATACRITGMVCLDRPVTEYTGELDSLGISIILGRIGGSAGVSLPTAPGTIVGGAGDWTAANPYGDVEGIICARFGWGVEGDEPYLRVNDTRDPNFRGNLTVAGNIGTGTGTIPVSANQCRLGEILTSGEILSRTSTCIRRAWIDGASGTVGVADASGVSRATMGTNAAGEGVVTSDTFTNTAGTARISADGDIWTRLAAIQAANIQTAVIDTSNLTNSTITNAIIANSTQTNSTIANATLANATLVAQALIGAGCTQEGAMAWGLNGTNWTIARCSAGVWGNAGGLSQSNVGGACPTDGAAAVSSTGQILYCSGNKWAYLGDRMGRNVLAESFVVTTNASVPKPVCLSGSSGASLYLIPANEEQKVQRVTRYIVDTGTSWKVLIRDGNNVDVQSTVIAQSYCNY